MTEYLKKRKHLAMAMEHYLECLIEKTPEKLPLSPDCRVTYNGEEAAVGSNRLWKNTHTIQQRQTFLDPDTGNVVFIGVSSNEAFDRKEKFRVAEFMEFISFLFSVRLKIVNGQITEIEELAKTGRSRYFYCLPEQVQLPDPIFETSVPEEERCTKEELIHLAELYWGSTFGDLGPEAMVVHPDCQRIENGYQTTNHSLSVRGDFKWNDAFQPGKGVKTMVPGKYISYPVVDVNRGIVVCFASMLMHIPDGRIHNLRIMEVFLIRDGCIKRIMAMFPYIDNYGGWITAGTETE